MPIVKGVEELVALFDESPGGVSAGYFSIVIALCYWFTVDALESLGETAYCRPAVRKFIADFAYPVSKYCDESNGLVRITFD